MRPSVRRLRPKNALAEEELKTKRAERRERELDALVRGKPIIQDLGDDASTKFLSFFFDETFADVEKELSKIELAFAARICK